MQPHPDLLGLETVKYFTENRVAWIVINRPSRANSVVPELCQDLLKALEKADDDAEVGAIVLTGEGRHFCAGADLIRLHEYREAHSPEARPFNVRELFPVTLKIRSTGLPVIAAVNGAAVSGGLGLALACDIRIASDRASFGETYVKLGMGLGNGGGHLLPWAVGTGYACELAFTGDLIDAERALQMRMVNRVVPHHRLYVETAALAERIAVHPKTALEAAKKAIYKGMRQSLNDTLEDAVYMIGYLQTTSEQGASVQAFFDKHSGAS